VLQQMPKLDRIMGRLSVWQGKSLQATHRPGQLPNCVMPTAIGEDMQLLELQAVSDRTANQHVGIDHDDNVVMHNNDGSGHSNGRKNRFPSTGSYPRATPIPPVRPVNKQPKRTVKANS